MTGTELVIGILLLVMAVFLIISILMQSGKSKRLSGSIAGGAETFFGKQKGQAIDKKLSKITNVVALIFVALILVLLFVDAKNDDKAANDKTDKTEQSSESADDKDESKTESKVEESKEESKVEESKEESKTESKEESADAPASSEEVESTESSVDAPASSGLDACLLDQRVALQLVHHRLYIHIVGEVEEAGLLEVAHADGTRLAVVIGFLHRPPRAEHVAVGLMDEQQVDVVCLQLTQAFVDAFGCLFLSVV